MIDTQVETPAALRLAAQFFIDHAALKEAVDSQLRDATPPANVPMGTPEVPAAPLVAPAAASPAAFTPNAPTATVVPPPPPPPNNVLPFAPPPTNAPIAVTPGMSAPVSPSSGATALPGVSGAPLASDEYDDHGVPYDARIHQKGKSKKKDGSWKLQKGIADALVSQVMQELAPRIRKPQPATTPAALPPPPADVPPAGFGTTPLPVGASAAPVSLPPPPPLPPVSGGPQGVGSPTQAQGIAPPPPPPAETVAPPADPFRALVAKITAARGAKPTPRLTAEEVTQCCASAGVPGLQALNAMPHLIATVEANVDALLATR